MKKLAVILIAASVVGCAQGTDIVSAPAPTGPVPEDGPTWYLEVLAATSPAEQILVEAYHYGLDYFSSDPECGRAARIVTSTDQPLGYCQELKCVGFYLTNAFDRERKFIVVWVQSGWDLNFNIHTAVHEALHAALDCAGDSDGDHSGAEWELVGAVAKDFIKNGGVL